MVRCSWWSCKSDVWLMPRVLACVVDAGADGVTCAEVASAAEVGADQWGGNSLLRCSPLSPARNVVTVGPIPVMAPSFCASLSFSSRRSVFAEYFYAYLFLHLVQASFSVFSEHFNTRKRGNKNCL